MSEVSKGCKQYGGAELESKLLAAGVPCGRLLTVAEVPEDPHVQSRQIIEEVEHPGAGRFKMVRTPIMVSGELPRTRMRPPLLGEHTSQILAELGYSEEGIRQLIDRSIAFQYSPQTEATGKVAMTK